MLNANGFALKIKNKKTTGIERKSRGEPMFLVYIKKRLFDLNIWYFSVQLDPDPFLHVADLDQNDIDPH